MGPRKRLLHDENHGQDQKDKPHLTPPNERHARGPRSSARLPSGRIPRPKAPVHSQEFEVKHIRSGFKTRQEHQRLAHVRHVHHGLRLDAAVRLTTSLGGVSAHRGLGVADVELGGGDGVFAAVEGCGTGKAGDGVLGHGVCGGVCGR